MRLTTALTICLLVAIVNCNHSVWVSTLGKDSNNGTEAFPFATVQKAIEVIASGDPSANYEDNLINIEAGSYNEAQIDASIMKESGLTILGNGLVTFKELTNVTYSSSAFTSKSKYVLHVSNITFEHLQLQKDEKSSTVIDDISINLSYLEISKFDMGQAIYSAFDFQPVQLEMHSCTLNMKKGYWRVYLAIGSSLVVDSATVDVQSSTSVVSAYSILFTNMVKATITNSYFANCYGMSVTAFYNAPYTSSLQLHSNTFDHITAVNLRIASTNSVVPNQPNNHYDSSSVFTNNKFIAISQLSIAATNNTIYDMDVSGELLANNFVSITTSGYLTVGRLHAQKSRVALSASTYLNCSFSTFEDIAVDSHTLYPVRFSTTSNATDFAPTITSANNTYQHLQSANTYCTVSAGGLNNGNVQFKNDQFKFNNAKITSSNQNVGIFCIGQVVSADINNCMFTNNTGTVNNATTVSPPIASVQNNNYNAITASNNQFNPIPVCTIGSVAQYHLLPCQMCKRGYAGLSEVADTCTPCPTGHYAEQEGSTTCEPCAIGYYTNVTATAQCKKCSGRSYSVSVGSSNCTECSSDEPFYSNTEECESSCGFLHNVSDGNGCYLNFWFYILIVLALILVIALLVMFAFIGYRLITAKKHLDYETV